MLEFLILDNWCLFPVSIGIATIAMSSGIGGAVFFSPLILVVMGLSPRMAIGSALINPDLMKVTISVLFILKGIFMLYTLMN